MRIVGIAFLIVLALAIVSCMAAAQQTRSGAGMDQGKAQTFSLGDDTSYRIVTISQIDTWRSSEMGIPWVSVPADTTAYVIYTKSPLQSIGTGIGPKDTIVFGPAGFMGAVAWNGTGNMKTFQFAGKAGQNFMIAQLSGGTQDRAVVSFS
jgi:hypothetical protein